MTDRFPAWKEVEPEHCPTCGQTVTVVTSDEGTSHYEGAAAEQERERIRKFIHDAIKDIRPEEWDEARDLLLAGLNRGDFLDQENSDAS